MTAIVGRRMIALGLVCVGLLCLAASAQAAGPTLDPSETNQSMWRCVPGSAFYKPYECNAGDLHNAPLDSFAFDPMRR